MYGILSKPYEVVGADIFSMNSNTLLYIVDYYRKFPIMKKADGLSADDLIRAAKVVFTEFELPKKNSLRHRQILYHTNLNNFADGWI